MSNKNILTKDQIELVNEKADEIAKDMGYEDAADVVDTLKKGSMNATNATERGRLERIAGDFVSKLQPVLYQQRLLNAIGTGSIYNWVNKFRGESLTWGNDIVFTQTYLTNAGNYDINTFVPNRLTGQKIDTFKVQWLNDNGTLTDSSYKYKKSLSLQPKTWLPYFQSGKLNEIIANITAEMEETYTMFIAYTIQQMVKQIADGGAQVALDASGVNGKNCKLHTFNSQAPDTFQAILELIGHIYDLTKDSNKMTIASDGQNLRAVNMDDLVIFIPKPLLAKFQSGILSRLPSAEKFKYDEIFSSERIIPIGAEIKPVKVGNNTSTDQQDDSIVDLVANDAPFINTNNKIIVMERRAIQHWKVVSQTETQFFAENLVTQLTNHEWGFTFVLPFAKGFVFKCDNLLTDPVLPNP